MFVLEQSGTAKKLTGQTLENWLVSFADGHGGIQSIEKTGTTGTNPVVDTYTITLADTTTATFTVTNGLKGDTGEPWYVHIKYAPVEPTDNSEMSNNPDNWMGIYSGTSSTAPTSYTAYTWVRIKGDTGSPSLLSSSEVVYQSGTTGTVVPSGTWSAEPPIVGAGNYLWTRTTLTFNTGNPVVFYSASRQGVDGQGAAGVSTPLVDVAGGAVGESSSFAREDHQHPLPTLHLSATVTSLPKSIDNDAITADMRVVNIEWGTPGAIQSNVAWSTSAGSLVLSGTMSGSTTAEIDLVKF